MKDKRIAKLMDALRRKFPGTTLITGPMPDAPDSGETLIKVLNAPMDPPGVVFDFAWSVKERLWGDEPIPALVMPIGRESTAKYYSEHLPRRRTPRRARRRRPPARGRTRVAGRGR